LRTAIGARLQGTTLVHTSQSGEHQVFDFIGVAGAARQSLPLRHTGRKVLIFQRFAKLIVWRPIFRPILLIARLVANPISFKNELISVTGTDVRDTVVGLGELCYASTATNLSEGPPGPIAARMSCF
jgi:hypothetical protein